MAEAPPATSTTTTTITDTAPDIFTSDAAIAKFNVPLGAYLETAPDLLVGVCVGAFVFDSADRLLLVQRAPHDSYPLRWEVPGGAIDDEDKSILHGVARELWEEAGLRARHVGGLVGKADTFLTRSGRAVCKYSFLVDVEGFDVKLDPNEHVAFLWVSEQEAKAKKCGDVEIVYTGNRQEAGILAVFGMERKRQDKIEA
ncbi:NUDIX hydrolase domain-like protein [Astrocystis sublimbata]|nr:NUDIX hydrolase domain-like protein [Astrocystis sublimbata]